MKIVSKITNHVARIIIGWLIVSLVLPLFGVAATSADVSIVTGIFFVAYYTRAYVIRRVFNAI